MRSLNLCVGGVDLVAMIAERDGEDMVAVRPICMALGLSWGSQQQKLTKMKDRLMCIDIDTRDSIGRQQQMLCIPIKKVAAWLFTINPNKVKETYKATVIAFQDELQHVLYSYVKGDLTHEKLDMLLRIIEEMRADNAELKADNAELKADNAELKADNAEMMRRIENLEHGTDAVVTHYASAGSYGLHAAKARKRHLRIAAN